MLPHQGANSSHILSVLLFPVSFVFLTIVI